MNYLITGGTGFLGSYICKQLIDNGHHVVCYDHTPNCNSIEQVLCADDLLKIKVVQGDIRDIEKLVHVCRSEQIDKIIHLASLLQVDSEENVSAAVQTNIAGTVNIFETARTCDIKRVVWASSNSVFGTGDACPVEYIPNDGQHSPNSIYAKCKDACEYFGKHYNERYGLETVALRYVVIYGKARMRGASIWINNLINEPALGHSTKVPNGDDAPNCVYVKDAARATILAAEATSLKRSAYTITGEAKSMAAIRDYVLTLIAGVSLELLPGRMAAAWKYDTSVEQSELGYIPEYNLERGVRETINLLRADAGLPAV